MSKKTNSSNQIQIIKTLAQHEYDISEDDVRILISEIISLFKTHLISAGYSAKNIQTLITKFRDAGRRSAPWQPASQKVPGRPQDGADGNRRLRWLFESEHKFMQAKFQQR